VARLVAAIVAALVALAGCAAGCGTGPRGAPCDAAVADCGRDLGPLEGGVPVFIPMQIYPYDLTPAFGGGHVASNVMLAAAPEDAESMRISFSATGGPYSVGYAGTVSADLRRARWWRTPGGEYLGGDVAWGTATALRRTVDYTMVPDVFRKLLWVRLQDPPEVLWEEEQPSDRHVARYVGRDTQVLRDDSAVWLFRRRLEGAPEGTAGTYVQRVSAEGETLFAGLGDEHAQELRPLGGKGLTRTTAQTSEGGVWYVLDGPGLGEDGRYGLRAHHRGPDGRVDVVSAPLIEPSLAGLRGVTDRVYPWSTETYAEAAWGLRDDGLLVHVVARARVEGDWASTFVRLGRDGQVRWSYRTREGWAATGDPGFRDVRAVAQATGEVWALLTLVGEWDVHYLLRLDAEGAPVWPEDAVPFPVPPGYTGRVWEAELAPDPEGGVFLAYRNDSTAFVEKLDAWGTPQWTTNGLGVYTAVVSLPTTWLGQFLDLLPDGRGGVWVAQSDYWSAASGLQHVDREGRVLLGRIRYEPPDLPGVFLRDGPYLRRRPDGGYEELPPTDRPPGDTAMHVIDVDPFRNGGLPPR
jgi:hypothetical protein